MDSHKSKELETTKKKSMVLTCPLTNTHLIVKSYI